MEYRSAQEWVLDFDLLLDKRVHIFVENICTTEDFDGQFENNIMQLWFHFKIY